MDSRSRLFATLVIWTAYVLVLVLGVPASNMSGDSAGMVALFGGFAGFLTTGFFWNWGRLPLTGDTSHTFEAEKSKRRQRVEGILNALSDEDIEILRRRLSNDMDDDELVSLDSLMTHDGEIRRRSRSRELSSE